VDDAITEQATLGTAEEFEAVKLANFDPALTPFVHYNLWVHDQAAGNSSGGVCCFGEDGQDFLISLGSWGGNQNGTPREQAADFMHEFGHALGLGHGGVANDAGVDILDDTTLEVLRRVDTAQAGIPFSTAVDTGTGRDLYVGDLRSGELRRFSYTSGTPT
jgi:hypothetical protein